MRIYLLRTDVDRFDVAEPPAGGVDPFPAFTGAPLAAGWSPLPVERVSAGERGDFLGFRTHAPVLGERAWEALRPMIEPHVEALPLDLEGETVYAINVLTVLDCLDAEASGAVRFSTGEIMDVDRYVLRPGCVGREPIFKLRGVEAKDVFVTRRFRDAVRRHGLTGAAFVRTG